MPTLKAVLFDLDDTLLDWSGFKGDWREVERTRMTGLHTHLADAGHAIPPLDALLDAFRDHAMAAWEASREDHTAPHLGRVLRSALAKLGVPDHALDDEVALLARYEHKLLDDTVIFPDVPDVLALLHAHGVKTGIVTNAFQPMTLRDAEVRAMGILDFFPDCRISAADVGYLKPHPAIFTCALDTLRVQPDEAVFVGDSLSADIVGAQRAGIKAVWRDTGLHPSRDLLGEITPDAQLKSLAQLPAILDGWFPHWRATNGAGAHA